MNNFEELVLLALELEGGRIHSADGRCLANLENLILGEERPVGSYHRSRAAKRVEEAVLSLEASGKIYVLRRNERLGAKRGNWVETIRTRD